LKNRRIEWAQSQCAIGVRDRLGGPSGQTVHERAKIERRGAGGIERQGALDGAQRGLRKGRSPPARRGFPAARRY
jgi:hypothetical protein